MSFDSIVREILNEGAKESKALLAKTFPNDIQLQTKLLNLDQTPSKGDIPAIIKFYNETKNLTDLEYTFNIYSKLKSRNIPIKAPSVFKAFIDFTEHVDAADTKQKLKSAPPVPTIEHEDSADKLVDTDELTIYKGDAQHKCVKYGEGYSFCISRRLGGNMYDSYRLQKESTFYFIFFKKIPKTNPKHIMVLDHTKDGWEWTFQDNNTKETTWDKVVKTFPILAQYKDLFINNPLTDAEEDKMEFIASIFANTPAQQKKIFLNADRDFQIVALQQGITITDELFSYLVNANLWDYINEYVSTGLNLTPLQADAIQEKGGAILKQYLKQREISIPTLVDARVYRYNILDASLLLVQQYIQDDNEAAYDKVEEVIKGVKADTHSGSIDLSKFTFLTKLPTNIPRQVRGSFKCNSTLITSLKGAPETVVGFFGCSYCSQLKSLKGAPKLVNGDFNCFNCQLTSLEGGPTTVHGEYNCYSNQLTSLVGAPRLIEHNFVCFDNKLKTLKDAPQKVGDGFNVNENLLVSLDGAPEIINGSFSCDNNQLTTLEGAPYFVGGDFYCQYNKLISFEGKPEEIGGRFRAVGNPITSTPDEDEQNDAIETDQFNESVKDILFAILGIGAVGLYNSKMVQDKINERPESKREKIEAIQLADKRIKTPKFHQVASEVLSKLKSTENDTTQQVNPPLKAKQAASDVAVYNKAVEFILPSEILGNNIYAQINNKFMKPYQDDVKKWTIGVGHLIGKGTDADRKAYIKARQAASRSPILTRPEAIQLFHTDVSLRVPRVKAKFADQWDKLSLNLKAALVDIEFRGDLEKKGPGDFKWVEELKKGNYKKAAAMYLDHKEYKKRKAKGSKAMDGVVKRMERNAKVIADEADSMVTIDRLL